MEKWDLYKLALDQFREHPKIYWARNTFFVTIQSGLIAFAAFDLKDPYDINFVDLLFATVGLVISLVWLFISLASRKLLRTWRQIVLQIEREVFDENIPEGGFLHQKQGLFQRSTNQGEGRSVGMSITAAMSLMAVFFVLSWCCLITYIGLQVFR